MFHLWKFGRKKSWIGVKLSGGVKSIFHHVLNGENPTPKTTAPAHKAPPTILFLGHTTTSLGEFLHIHGIYSLSTHIHIWRYLLWQCVVTVNFRLTDVKLQIWYFKYFGPWTWEVHIDVFFFLHGELKLGILFEHYIVKYLFNGRDIKLHFNCVEEVSQWLGLLWSNTGKFPDIFMLGDWWKCL